MFLGDWGSGAQKRRPAIAYRAENPLVTKTLMEFTRIAEENNWDFEALRGKYPADAASALGHGGER